MDWKGLNKKLIESEIEVEDQEERKVKTGESTTCRTHIMSDSKLLRREIVYY